jgi:hypothetical protein
LAASCRRLALLAPAANATPVRYDFTIALSKIQGTAPGADSGNGGGYVAFDTDLFALATGGHPGDLETPLPTIDLSVDWLGLHFDTSTGTLSSVDFDSLGNQTAWDIDVIVPPDILRAQFPLRAVGRHRFQCAWIARRWRRDLGLPRRASTVSRSATWPGPAVRSALCPSLARAP